MDAATNPETMALNAAGGALGEGVGHVLGAAVHGGNQALKQAEAKAGRLTSKSAASRVKKVGAALKKADEHAERVAAAAEAAVVAPVETGKDMIQQNREEKERKK